MAYILFRVQSVSDRALGHERECIKQGSKQDGYATSLTTIGHVRTVF